MSKPKIPRKAVSSAPAPATELNTGRVSPPPPDLAAPDLRRLATMRFPAELKCAVEEAVIAADLHFRAGVAAAGDIDVRTLAGLRRQWFWTVLLGFAEGARDMVLRSVWTGARFADDWPEFYREAAQAAAIAWHLPHVDAELKNSAEWARFDAIRLEAAAAAQLNPDPALPAAALEAAAPSLRKAKPRKKQAAVIVNVAWLNDKLKALNARRKPPGQLELSAKGLARKSPWGAPKERTWEKLLNGEPVRKDVPGHLVRFFEHFGLDVEAITVDVDKLSRAGGHSRARAASMTPEQRWAAARKALQARWARYYAEHPEKKKTAPAPASSLAPSAAQEADAERITEEEALPATPVHRGRKPDLERSARIAAVVDRVVPGRDWQRKEKVYAILDELDAVNGPDPENPLLPPPSPWLTRYKWKKWLDCTNHRRAAKVIEHALEVVRKMPEN